MEEHNRLLEKTSDEVREIRQRQAVAQEEMSRAETESLRVWREEKAKSGVDESVVEKLLAGEDFPFPPPLPSHSIWSPSFLTRSKSSTQTRKSQPSRRPSMQTSGNCRSAMGIQSSLGRWSRCSRP